MQPLILTHSSATMLQLFPLASFYILQDISFVARFVWRLNSILQFYAKQSNEIHSSSILMSLSLGNGLLPER